tara:strand:+ start:430 stop:726 length:297 start_codon:yes stop_codon:yes gene_type:complete
MSQEVMIWVVTNVQVLLTAFLEFFLRALSKGMKKTKETSKTSFMMEHSLVRAVRLSTGKGTKYIYQNDFINAAVREKLERDCPGLLEKREVGEGGVKT